MENNAAGLLVRVVRDESGTPEGVLLSGGRGAVKIIRVLDRWRDTDTPSAGEAQRENWLVSTDGGICMLRHVAHAEWWMYGWREDAEVASSSTR